MKASACFVAYIAAAVASPFILPDLTTHQPNGQPVGETNFYSFAADIRSANSGQNKTGYCSASWADNTWQQTETYSVYVAANQWEACDSSRKNLGDKHSVFQYKLFQYFSIGNFSLEVMETLPNGTSLYGFTHVTNTTGSYTCTILADEVPDIQHARGDCNIAAGRSPLEIQAVTTESPLWQ